MSALAPTYVSRGKDSSETGMQYSIGLFGKQSLIRSDAARDASEICICKQLLKGMS